METFFVIIHGLIWFGVLAALIYLIVRRIRIMKTEDFEKRDN
ncbi:hypothetical protein [Aquimarina sp. MMG016]|nr:hypothetical protein [Aquimarina sp. MMG016]